MAARAPCSSIRLLTDPIQLVNRLQIDWLQPIYTLTFSNGLIACWC